jgi:hypothetical protein
VAAVGKSPESPRATRGSRGLEFQTFQRLGTGSPAMTHVVFEGVGPIHV